MPAGNRAFQNRERPADHYTPHGKYITGTVRAFHEEARAVPLSGGTYTRVPQKDVP